VPWRTYCRWFRRWRLARSPDALLFVTSCGEHNGCQPTTTLPIGDGKTHKLLAELKALTV
jgi:hypothetical protein